MKLNFQNIDLEVKCLGNYFFFHKFPLNKIRMSPEYCYIYIIRVGFCLRVITQMS